MNWIKLQIKIIFLRVVREIRMNYMNSYQKLPLFCKKTTLLRILSRLLSAFVKTILHFICCSMLPFFLFKPQVSSMQYGNLVDSSKTLQGKRGIFFRRYKGDLEELGNVRISTIECKINFALT